MVAPNRQAGSVRPQCHGAVPMVAGPHHAHPHEVRSATAAHTDRQTG